MKGLIPQLVLLAISIIIIIHGLTYPPDIVLARIIEVLTGGVLFYTSIQRIKASLKKR